MKYILTIGLLVSLLCCVVVSDVSAHGTDQNALDDIANAQSEQDRLQGIINEYIGKRDRYISLANDLKVRGGGSLGSLQTTMISSLSSATKTTLANTLGLTLRAFLSIYGSSSLASAIDSAVSDASSYHGSAQYLYNNPTRLRGYDAANSAIEAWDDGGKATDHYNAYHSSQPRNGPSAPIGPGNINFPKFECPGPCTQSWTTVDAAINTHHRKCGTAEPVSLLLSFRDKQAILAGRSVSEGCGVSWYSCGSDHSSNEAYHRVRTCAKGVWKTRYKDYTNGKERYRSHTCGDSFRNCMGHVDYHKSSTFKDAHSETDDTGSTPPTANPPPPSNPSPSPSYHPCGVHLTSVIGNHSLQATCSASNANGNCTVTSFYACDGHTHVYPSPPPTVSCGRRRCTETVSSTNEHRVGPCSACGNSYWSCGPHGSYHKNQHRERTCRRNGCGQKWRRCQGPTPRCSVAAGQGCWAR